MKKVITLFVVIVFFTMAAFAQEAAKKPVKDTSDIHSVKPKPTTETNSHPTDVTQPTDQTQTQTPTDQNIQFSMAGLLMASLQNWNDLQTDKSKLGFGMSGDLLGGIILDDMYIGLGPHLGYNFWTYSETVAGINASATTSVSDFGIDLGASWDGFFLTIGAGSSNVSVTAEAGGSSQTVDIPNSIGYKRVSFGWNDGFAFGIAFMSYNDEDIPNKLNRIEFNLGWAF
jgi:hypothetical protein